MCEEKIGRYVMFPRVDVCCPDARMYEGAGAIARALGDACGTGKCVLSIECYPGVDQQELLDGLAALHPALVIHSDDLAFEPEKLDAALERDLLPQDPVFGIMTVRRLRDFFYEAKIEEARQRIDAVAEGLVLVYGVGATLVHPGDVQVVADITRWEIQLRYRRGMTNWRTAQTDLPKLKKYKRGFFAEWRWADREKDHLLNTMDFYLDMTTQGSPAMVDGAAYREALRQTTQRPFRMVPYFDPGVWGGNWMKDHFELPENGSNYAWSFDGVPEENSLLLDFGGHLIQTPALNLVLQQPRALLGDRVHARFGKEFPIRFDMLDTINGQNLSLQVHPLTEYIQQNFNIHYTQDESYYILDAQEGSSVWLGVREGVDPAAMEADLRRAQAGEAPFPAEKYINHIPVKKHDHILIPAGTTHCSGAGTMVLEISATPYIFTFKLWDWGRLDLDGKPRPIHLDHGMANIQWDRDTKWVHENLVGQTTVVHQDENALVERTGLHEREFIDTFRYTTASSVTVARNGSVHVLNLVDGARARLVSPDGAFAPFELHYAETCILPQAAGDYRIEAPDGAEVKMIVACVRN
ncbi:MAG: class I mannose-6-phosphate isomerase [Gemmiger sp.]|uniref:class I mannose-6-phosphate isomerase n=1 Tax=Gemmiger sp. TaxID=2049027 RepID=UPI002E75CB2F|nr:class I mannose-6-phosphate isomerase [Gemmiger sp.]MEE0707591.1 class I mannose-6-phosphate isomerase [Gemmiger sp.]